MSKVSLLMSAKLAKEIVKAIETTDEQAVFVFDKHGLFVRVSDPLHIRVVEIMVEADTFDEYSYDTDEEQIRLGVVISRLKDITKTLVKTDNLKLEFEVGTNRVLTWSDSLQRSIRLIRSELMNDIPEISVSHLYDSVIDAKTLKPFLKAANVKGGVVDVITDDNFILCSESDEGSVEITLTAEEVQLKPTDYASMTTFSVEEINRAASTAVGQIQIRGKQDSPIEMRWNTEMGIKVKAWVASKV